jgi:hypothetical protein
LLSIFFPSRVVKDFVRGTQACHRCHRPAHLEKARIKTTVWAPKD